MQNGNMTCVFVETVEVAYHLLWYPHRREIILTVW